MAPDSWEFGITGPGERVDRPQVRVHRDLSPPTAPVTLRYGDRQTSFRFRGTVREAYREAGEAFGIRIVFDDEFGGETPIRADLTECDFHCAMRALEAVGSAFGVPLASDILYVAGDNPQARSRLEILAMTAIPIDGSIRPEDLAEVSQAIRQVLDIRSLQSHQTGGVVVRDTAAKVDMARALAQDLLRPKGEVRIEVRMVTVAQRGLQQAGMDLPTAFPVANLSTILGASPVAGATERLIGLGGGETVLGVSVGDASVAARLEANSAEIFQDLQLRTTHGTAAEFRVGERYPIMTARYSPGTTATPNAPTGGRSYVQPPPSITFEDLGLNLSVTPFIHSALEVTLELDVNFRFLAGAAVNEVPVLANREFQSQVRLKRGSFAIVSGMVVHERRRIGSGPAGLAQIPWLGAFFRRNEWRWERRELMILVRPRIVRLPAGELAASSTFLFGSETRPAPLY